jgi:hypothetical protein
LRQRFGSIAAGQVTRQQMVKGGGIAQIADKIVEIFAAHCQAVW